MVYCLNFDWNLGAWMLTSLFMFTGAVWVLYICCMDHISQEGLWGCEEGGWQVRYGHLTFFPPIGCYTDGLKPETLVYYTFTPIYYITQHNLYSFTVIKLYTCTSIECANIVLQNEYPAKENPPPFNNTFTVLCKIAINVDFFHIQ